MTDVFEDFVADEEAAKKQHRSLKPTYHLPIGELRKLCPGDKVHYTATWEEDETLIDGRTGKPMTYRDKQGVEHVKTRKVEKTENRVSMVLGGISHDGYAEVQGVITKVAVDQVEYVAFTEILKIDRLRDRREEEVVYIASPQGSIADRSIPVFAFTEDMQRARELVHAIGVRFADARERLGELFERLNVPNKNIRYMGPGAATDVVKQCRAWLREIGLSDELIGRIERCADNYRGPSKAELDAGHSDDAGDFEPAAGQVEAEENATTAEDDFKS